jgi:hypothetical protein
VNSNPSAIRELKLELLRPGPKHNQLLSPLTSYIALYGENGPFTVNVPFEHARLLARLERLRYSTENIEIARSQRESELREIGEDIGVMLAGIPSFLTALCMAGEQLPRFIHLRLSLSGSELALIPFETAIAPGSAGGNATPLFIRTTPAITITRELRHAQPLPLQWNRSPRILFAYASPEGYAEVPAEEHHAALRRAVEPWVMLHDDPVVRAQAADTILTVLPNATLEQIRKRCEETEFTHVHLLAHGAVTRRGVHDCFGLALAAGDDANAADIILGETLAIVLMSQDSTGAARRAPTLVSLATCDSGAQGSVLVPGGSIAEELHAAGLAWVVASQFPLWMSSSTMATEILYSRLLEGEDPRRVVHEIRQRLYTNARDTHDWASIVAYASLPESLESQVAAFRSRQIKSRTDVLFSRVDDLAGTIARSAPSQTRVAEMVAEIDGHFTAIRRTMTMWRDEPNANASRQERAERLGMAASCEKRMAIVRGLLKDEPSVKQSLRSYQLARDLYRQALEAEPANHWVMTQMVALLVTPGLSPDVDSLSHTVSEHADLWTTAKQIAKLHLRGATGTGLAWACGTSLELEMLGVVFDAGRSPLQARIERLKEYCRVLTDAVDGSDPFPIESTRRQFQRYLDHWHRPEWDELARVVVNALGGESA